MTAAENGVENGFIQADNSIADVFDVLCLYDMFS